MRLQVTALALALGWANAAPSTSSQQRAAEIASNPAIWDQLKNDPNLLPPHSRLILADRLSKLSLTKREPQSDAWNAIQGSILNGMWNWNKVRPPSKVPEVDVKNSTEFPGALQKKIRYGPYRVPPVSEKTWESQLLSVQGIANTLQVSAKKPCDTDCLMLALKASIEYDDGSPAENENGAWFHHGVLLNVGPSVKEAICGGAMIENLFMSGNERSEAKWAIPESHIKSGYHLHTSDTFILNTELMNLDEKEKWVWLTLTFDYLPDPHPEYKEGKVVWMSLGPERCTRSDTNPFGTSNLTKTQQPTKQKFYEYSVPWTVPMDGYILGSTAHMHDGGTGTEVFHNGKVFCDSKPFYANTSNPGVGGMGGMSGGAGGGHSHGRRAKVRRQHGAMMAPPTESNTDHPHIESNPPCVFADGIAV